jgi:hypothetical protein
VSTYPIAATTIIHSIESKLLVLSLSLSLSQTIVFFPPQVRHFHLACSLPFHAQVDIRREWPLCAKINGLPALGSIEWNQANKSTLGASYAPLKFYSTE